MGRIVRSLRMGRIGLRIYGRLIGLMWGRVVRLLILFKQINRNIIKMLRKGKILR